MNVGLIVAAGQGTRLGDGVPKQFRELGSAPIIIHTLKRFEDATTINEVIVVVAAGDAADFLALAHQHRIGKLARVVSGGATRLQSVWRGVQAVRQATAEIIAVHDGVRPFVTPEEIDRTVRAAATSGAAILVAPAVDTIKEVHNGMVTRTLERAQVRHALTPQCFRYELLRRAYEQALTDNFDAATDDSQLVERTGATVTIIDGHPRNIKITHKEDLARAEIILKQEVGGQMSDVGD